MMRHTLWGSLCVRTVSASIFVHGAARVGQNVLQFDTITMTSPDNGEKGHPDIALLLDPLFAEGDVHKQLLHPRIKMANRGEESLTHHRAPVRTTISASRYC